ncbi:hypothetical protein HYPSUDRAFT_205421 [Hypholoma sublateritium FD-334 SS-4]|uniref:Uncharacterized protein n=1 Tax=Hypholoma sublateritium (strain FD-334 SS-4) TaxID=945553 RepID=A0A0D2PE30_HYPSF|nr:hypothetical protein HYPSUDRAFT_205421 [Hypholoma sublateritium FD-334 SS-4]
MRSEYVSVRNTSTSPKLASPAFVLERVATCAYDSDTPAHAAARSLFGTHANQIHTRAHSSTGLLALKCSMVTGAPSSSSRPSTSPKNPLRLCPPLPAPLLERSLHVLRHPSYRAASPHPTQTTAPAALFVTVADGPWDASPLSQPVVFAPAISVPASYPTSRLVRAGRWRCFKAPLPVAPSPAAASALRRLVNDDALAHTFAVVSAAHSAAARSPPVTIRTCHTPSAAAHLPRALPNRAGLENPRAYMRRAPRAHREMGGVANGCCADLVSRAQFPTRYKDEHTAARPALYQRRRLLASSAHDAHSSTNGAFSSAYDVIVRAVGSPIISRSRALSANPD